MPHRRVFLFVDCGIADEPVLKTFVFLSVNTSWSEDAGAGGAAARRQPQAEPNTHGISWKPAAEAGAEWAPLPSGANGAREMWERAQAQRGIISLTRN
jgi:hypothetical protein